MARIEPVSRSSRHGDSTGSIEFPYIHHARKSQSNVVAVVMSAQLLHRPTEKYGSLVQFPEEHCGEATSAGWILE